MSTILTVANERAATSLTSVAHGQAWPLLLKHPSVTTAVRGYVGPPQLPQQVRHHNLIHVSAGKRLQKNTKMQAPSQPRGEPLLEELMFTTT